MEGLVFSMLVSCYCYIINPGINATIISPTARIIIKPAIRMVKNPFQLDILWAAPMACDAIKIDQIVMSNPIIVANAFNNIIGADNGGVIDVNRSPPKMIADSGQDMTIPTTTGIMHHAYARLMSSQLPCPRKSFPIQKTSVLIMAQDAAPKRIPRIKLITIICESELKSPAPILREKFNAVSKPAK